MEKKDSRIFQFNLIIIFIISKYYDAFLQLLIYNIFFFFFHNSWSWGIINHIRIFIHFFLDHKDDWRNQELDLHFQYEVGGLKEYFLESLEKTKCVYLFGFRSLNKRRISIICMFGFVEENTCTIVIEIFSLNFNWNIF